jgi:hypothetical protein
LKVRICLILLFLLSMPTLGLAQESALAAQLRGEGDRIVESCGTFSFKTVPGCGYALFTDRPFHIAAGSLPPQNGFGLGGAFVWTRNTRNWRLSWDADAIGSTNASWRAGAYMKIVHNPHPKENPIAVIIPGQTPPSSTQPVGSTFTHPYTFFDVYAQSIALNQLNYFGLGNDSSLAGKSVFGMSETVVGVSATKPVFEWAGIEKLHLSLLGEVNGRFVSIRPESGQPVPSIGALYNNATAPGLATQPGFAQLGEGVRIAPDIGNFEFNYLAKFQQFVAPSDSHNSFLRWTIDLNHTYYLRERAPASRSASMPIGPDSCAASNDPCPPIPHTFNNTGSIGVRLLFSGSVTSATSAVPFYFQPTLGGEDLNSSLALGSYQDYRFRGPNLLLLQETVEHSVWGPFGVMLQFDQGQVALTHSDFGIGNFKESYAAGVTLRAGAFPMVYLLFAWGGPESHHTVFNMNTSLLGGASRPPLN